MFCNSFRVDAVALRYFNVFGPRQNPTSQYAAVVPKFIGTIFEVLSAPISSLEIVLGYVGAAAAKAMLIGLIILGTSFFFVDIRVQHPVWMLTFLTLTSVSFSLLGFILGIWARNFEQLNLVPLLVVTPMVFLGGSFYSITMLPEWYHPAGHFNNGPGSLY